MKIYLLQSQSWTPFIYFAKFIQDHERGNNLKLENKLQKLSMYDKKLTDEILIKNMSDNFKQSKLSSKDAFAALFICTVYLQLYRYIVCDGCYFFYQSFSTYLPTRASFPCIILDVLYRPCRPIFWGGKQPNVVVDASLFPFFFGRYCCTYYKFYLFF